MNKCFILGLPRTGTTSVCAASLNLGFSVAHTGLSKETFRQADVIADTPVYCDYPYLDKLFPGSKFVYLERDVPEWIISIQLLLHKISPEMTRDDGGLNPVIRRCFREVFKFDGESFNTEEQFLRDCFERHREHVEIYFTGRDVLRINLAEPGSLTRYCEYLGVKPPVGEFPHLNRNGKITAWKKIKHRNKINSIAYGEDRKRFFDYR